MAIASKGTVGGVLPLWNKESVECKDFILGEIISSCLFVNRRDNGEWFFSGDYCRGNAKERSLFKIGLSLWRGIMAICNKVLDCTRWEVGNGNKIYLWQDS